MRSIMGWSSLKWEQQWLHFQQLSSLCLCMELLAVPLLSLGLLRDCPLQPHPHPQQAQSRTGAGTARVFHPFFNLSVCSRGNCSRDRLCELCGVCGLCGHSTTGCAEPRCGGTRSSPKPFPSAAGPGTGQQPPAAPWLCSECWMCKMCFLGTAISRAAQARAAGSAHTVCEMENSLL